MANGINAGRIGWERIMSALGDVHGYGGPAGLLVLRDIVAAKYATGPDGEEDSPRREGDSLSSMRVVSRSLGEVLEAEV